MYAAMSRVVMPLAYRSTTMASLSLATTSYQGLGASLSKTRVSLAFFRYAVLVGRTSSASSSGSGRLRPVRTGAMSSWAKAAASSGVVMLLRRAWYSACVRVLFIVVGGYGVLAKARVQTGTRRDTTRNERKFRTNRAYLDFHGHTRHPFERWDEIGEDVRKWLRYARWCSCH